MGSMLPGNLDKRMKPTLLLPLREYAPCASLGDDETLIGPNLSRRDFDIGKRSSSGTRSEADAPKTKRSAADGCHPTALTKRNTNTAHRKSRLSIRTTQDCPNNRYACSSHSGHPITIVQHFKVCEWRCTTRL